MPAQSCHKHRELSFGQLWHRLVHSVWMAEDWSLLQVCWILRAGELRSEAERKRGQALGSRNCWNSCSHASQQKVCPAFLHKEQESSQSDPPCFWHSTTVPLASPQLPAALPFWMEDPRRRCRGSHRESERTPGSPLQRTGQGQVQIPLGGLDTWARARWGWWCPGSGSYRTPAGRAGARTPGRRS